MRVLTARVHLVPWQRQALAGHGPVPLGTAQAGSRVCALQSHLWLSTGEQIHTRVTWAELRSKARSPVARRRCTLRCALFPLPAAERLPEKEAEDLMAWMRNALGSRVTGVKVGVPGPSNRAREICGGNNPGVKGGGGLGICCHRFFFRL